MRLLVTGANGVIGRALVPLLAASGADLLLLRRRIDRSEDGAQVRGDIELEGLGLDDPASIFDTIDGIVHCAARTDFAVDRLAAERANVTGTENLLRFAERCRKLDRIVLLSTVYVAGKRTGVVRGEELEHDFGFVNEYERSKYLMEQRANEARRRLPIAVIRTSTIIGDSGGRVARFEAVHRALELYYRGLIPMIAGSNETPVDLVTSDHVAAAIARFTLEEFSAATVQCSLGDAALPLSRFLELTHRLFEEADSRWRARGVEKPPVVTAEAFAALENSVRISGDPFFSEVLRAMSHFMPQLIYPKRFISDFDEPKDFLAAYERVIRYCVANDFGRRARH